MIAPPASAYLLTDRLERMILFSVLIAIGGAVSGYWMARALDASIAGSMAVTAGVLFLMSYLFAPGRGFVAAQRMKKQQRLQFAFDMLTVHLLHHTGAENADLECREDHLRDHIRWTASFAESVTRRASRAGIIEIDDGDRGGPGNGGVGHLGSPASGILPLPCQKAKTEPQIN
jgi:manganese/zinc/iron transport system permease protein